MKKIKLLLAALLFCGTAVAQSPAGTKPLTEEVNPLSEDSIKSIMSEMSLKLYHTFHIDDTLYYEVINKIKNTTTSFSVHKPKREVGIDPVLTFYTYDKAKGPTAVNKVMDISFNALLYATKYINFFEQKHNTILGNESTIILSRKNFQELKTTKKTFLDIGNGLELFILYDTNLGWNYKKTLFIERNESKIEVLDDVNCPIILLIKTATYTIKLNPFYID